MSSQKRGVSRGVPVDLPLLPTQSPMFSGKFKGLLSCFKFLKTGYSIHGLKLAESFLMWNALPKTQRSVLNSRYSPCDNTPTTATAALTIGGVSLLIFKNIGGRHRSANIDDISL